MKQNQQRRREALRKELLAVEKQEKKMQQAAVKVKGASWKSEFENRIPEKVYRGLESAFCKGFELVFNQGRVIIEKGYNKEDLQADFAIQDYAVQLKGGRKELKNMHKSAKRSDISNIVVTTVEGVGLGILGIGLPDIVLFLGNLMKGIYQTALNYGFDYVSKEDQLLILKMMQTALSTSDAWIEGDAEVDALFAMDGLTVTDEQLKMQMKETASVLALDMLVLKFIQGFPVVGIIGGAANPLYYSKIMKYVQLKYREQYLLKC